MTKNLNENNSFNGLMPVEWAKLSKSVWGDIVTPKREWFQLEHGVTYPINLAERVIKFYSKIGDTVLDPFMGVGTTMIAAKNLGRNGYGFEIYEKFYNIAKELLLQKQVSMFNNHSDIKIYNDDCRNIHNYISGEIIQLTLTSPPYANFIYRLC